jgi:hypothetical protein
MRKEGYNEMCIQMLCQFQGGFQILIIFKKNFTGMLKV